MTHAASFGFVALFVAASMRWVSPAMGPRESAVLGALLGLAFMTRPQEAVFALFPAALLLTEKRRSASDCARPCGWRFGRWPARRFSCSRCRRRTRRFCSAANASHWSAPTAISTSSIRDGPTRCGRRGTASCRGRRSRMPRSWGRRPTRRGGGAGPARHSAIVFVMAWVNGSTADWAAGWSFGGRRFTSCLVLLAPGLAFLDRPRPSAADDRDERARRGRDRMEPAAARAVSAEPDCRRDSPIELRADRPSAGGDRHSPAVHLSVRVPCQCVVRVADTACRSIATTCWRLKPCGRSLELPFDATAEPVSARRMGRARGGSARRAAVDRTETGRARRAARPAAGRHCASKCWRGREYSILRRRHPGAAGQRPRRSADSRRRPPARLGRRSSCQPAPGSGVAASIGIVFDEGDRGRSATRGRLPADAQRQSLTRIARRWIRWRT